VNTTNTTTRFTCRLGAALALVLALLTAGCAPMAAPPPAADLLIGNAPRVVDGDTLRVTIDSEERRVRILGIDTPEAGDCGHDESAERLAELIDVDDLTLALDPVADPEDRYGRILAYVATADIDDIGLALIDEGLAAAWWPSSAPTPTRGRAYQEAESEAQRSGRGSWALCDTVGR
jgi:endonuclease YncB( thermonuclease family)